ncbi:MAG: META domain-containing protein [Gammaproteobacteria bacterium]|nr:META domain-containing protein [Gammaproteobacteria bacterium]
MRFISNSIGCVSLIVLLVSLAMSGCTSVSHVNASSIQDLKNLSYQGIYAEPVTLKNGIYEGRPFVAGGASRPRVQFIEQLMVSGDMTGDGNDEAAVFLMASSGGSGSYTYLAIVTKNGSSYQNIATKNLGDRVQVRALRLAEGTLILDFITAGPDDAMCCPSLKMRNTYRLVAGQLKQITDKQMGPFSLRDLDGMKWSLSELTQNEPVPPQVTVTAVFDGNRLSGSSGCNRYFNDIKGSGPQDIVIGTGGVTRMMCPEPIMQVEDRYLAALQKVGQFGFMFGQLMLSYEDGGKQQRLLFIPRQDEIAQ